MCTQNEEKYAVSCEQLGRTYGEVAALVDLNLAVPAGSIFGFLGRNGAGKTTTMRLLTGLARPTTGRAWVAGVETTNGDSSAREHFGYLPQDPAFYTWMTPFEYLDYVGRLFHMPDELRRQRIDTMLELTGLQDAAKRRIRGFSGGMQQRLGIAQAMLHNPPVLFLDEPTSALDPAGRYELLDMLASLRGKVTVFFSSHILADVERICDTIGVIHKGHLIQVSPREELLDRHAVNAVELVADVESSSQLNTFMAQLNKETWVENVTRIEKTIRVLVNDLAAGKQNLLPIVVAHRIGLNRYEWVRPSLEEVFLELSS